MARQRLNAVALGAMVLLTGCGTSTGTDASPSASGALQAVLVGSETLPGTQRIPIGILSQNTPINDATVHVRAFYLNGATPAFKSESDAPFRGAGLEGRGLYIAHLSFDRAGSWMAAVTAQRPDGSHSVTQVPLTVVPTATVPAPGQPAPRSQNPTVKDVPDVSYIDSGQPPDDMHQLSIADAVAQHRPALVVFATPAFCTSRTCGPQVHAVQTLEPAYRDRMTFIHVEIYQDFKPDPSKRQFSKTVIEWRLQTEPWVFLIDSKGLINTRLEATADSDEMKTAVDQMLAVS